jgi:hypothetical protein
MIAITILIGIAPIARAAAVASRAAICGEIGAKTLRRLRLLQGSCHGQLCAQILKAPEGFAPSARWLTKRALLLSLD